MKSRSAEKADICQATKAIREERVAFVCLSEDIGVVRNYFTNHNNYESIIEVFVKPSLFKTIVLCCISAVTVLNAHPQKLIITFFGSSTCGECMTIKEQLLKPFAEKHADSLRIDFRDVDDTADFQLMIQMEKQYNVIQNSAQELFFPDTFITGFDDIMRLGQTKIMWYLDRPETWGHPVVSIDSTSFSTTLRDRFSKFSFVSILLAGIVDGVNPCAIATMIFLISFLATQKRKRSEILAIGMVFTAAVFLTYLGLGVGAFEALTFLKKYLWVSYVIKWSAVIFALSAAVYCFRDAIVYKKTGNIGDVKVQLSKGLKLKIHKTISENLSSRSLIVGTLVTGFLVTLLEAVCTGQVYLPTIILMTRENGLKLTGWLYLLFYNFLFVLPLLIIMILAYFGMTWDKLAKKTQKHLPLLKTLLGIVLVALAVFLAVSM